MDFKFKKFIFFCLGIYVCRVRYLFTFYFIFIMSHTHTHKYIFKNAKGDFLKILLKLDIGLITVSFQITNKDVSFKLSC